MTRRHGAFINGVGDPRCLLGIWQIFAPWVNPRLLGLQGFNRPSLTRPVRIEFHFRRVVHRLVRSLAHFHQRTREWDEFLEAGGLASGHPELAFEIPEEGGIAADSVFHYLHLFIEDIARVVPFVLLGDGAESKEPASFAVLKKSLEAESTLGPARLRELFLELNREDSWWSMGFSYGAGIRQRLTHYTDLVLFHGNTKHGGLIISGDVSLASVGGPVDVKDFEIVLEELFSKLCEWLDQLDHLLLGHLSETMAAKGVSWNPLAETCPDVALPKQDQVRLGARHYLYFPLFDRFSESA